MQLKVNRTLDRAPAGLQSLKIAMFGVLVVFALLIGGARNSAPASATSLATASSCPANAVVTRELEASELSGEIKLYLIRNRTPNCNLTVFFNGTFTCVTTSANGFIRRYTLPFSNSFLVTPGSFGREQAQNIAQQCKEFSGRKKIDAYITFWDKYRYFAVFNPVANITP